MSVDLSAHCNSMHAFMNIWPMKIYNRNEDIYYIKIDFVLDTSAPNYGFYTGDITKASLSWLSCKQFAVREMWEQ